MARIAYMLGHFPTLSETFVGSEMRAMEAAGHTLFPIALHDPKTGFQPEDEAFAKRTLYFSPINPEASQALAWQYLLRFPRLFSFLRRQTTEPRFPLFVHAAHIANYIRENGCTHIHAHFAWGATTYAIAAAKLLGIPVTFTCHGSDVYARPVDLALKCSNASAVLGVAPTITADIQKIAPETPCHLVYCGVDTERFRPAEDQTKKHMRWLFTGRLMDCKGIEDILAAWGQIPLEERPSLDIIGDGPLREKLEIYVREHQLEHHITFPGPKTSEWIAANGPYYYAFISAFKQGKDGSRDTAPMVLKEAMAMALPIVTTDFVDIPVVVGKECAVLCPAASADELLKAIMHFQKLPAEILREMGQAGRKRAESHYSSKQQAQRMTDIFTLSQRRK